MNKEAFLGQSLKGGYQVDSILGAGTFGTTFLAHQENNATPVAVKIFEETSDPLKLVELAQEAINIAQLRHPNIVLFKKFDIEQWRFRDDHEKEITEHFPFIVMGYANNGSLRRLKPTRSTTPVAADQVVDLLVQAANGVQFAHDHPNPIIHRDLKPDNILLHKPTPRAPHFDVLVADFGIAIAAHTEGSLEPQNQSGTLPYMAPEQFARKTVRASDQFALGIITYEFLTGKRPYAGLEREHLPPSFQEALKQTGNEKLMNTVLEYLEEVVMKALAKNPQERYPSVSDFAHALDETHVKAVEEMEKQRKAFEAAKPQQQEASPQQKPEILPPWLNAQYLLKQGELHLQEANYKEALQLFDFAVQLYPKNAEALVNSGRALHLLGRKEEALIMYDQAIKLNPKDSAAYYNKGDALRDLGRDDEAIREYDQAIKLNPHYSEAYRSKGLALLFLGRYGKALIEYDQAIKINPQDSEAYYYKGDALHFLGRKEEALIACDQAIKLSPQFSKDYFFKGLLLKELGRSEEELVAYDQAIKIYPQEIYIYFSKGEALEHLGRKKEALQVYEKILEIDPSEKEALENVNRLKES